MSGDEVLALAVSAVIAVVGWMQWLGALLMLKSMSRRSATRSLVWIAPPLAGAAMFLVLRNWASHDVRDAPVYIFFYMVMWLAWLGLWNLLLPYLGMLCRDDALERDNPAAGLAIAGMWIGVTFIFAGGNVGDGPGWWVVVFTAALGTTIILVLWIVSNLITRLHEAITVDRDTATGWRTAGFFIGSGLILGQALTGDWESARETVSDFAARGWPVLVLWGVALMFDRVGRPTPERPAPNPLLFGILPALFFGAAGVGDLIAQGAFR